MYTINVPSSLRHLAPSWTQTDLHENSLLLFLRYTDQMRDCLAKYSLSHFMSGFLILPVGSGWCACEQMLHDHAASWSHKN